MTSGDLQQYVDLRVDTDCPYAELLFQVGHTLDGLTCQADGAWQ
jgi:hypothetical protein